MAKAKVVEKTKTEEADKEPVNDNWGTRGKEKKVKCRCTAAGGGGAIYFFGLIGSLIYFFQHLGPATLGNIFWAIVKSIAWPALFVYKVLEIWKF